MNLNYQIIGCILGCFGLVSGIATPAFAQQQTQNGGQGYTALPVPKSVLRVTGSANRFTLIADRADVRDAIKIVFDQAERQFTLDSNVVGQVTLRLQEQPLALTLNALCRQAFLKYRTDPTTKITFFERDDVAVREAFTRLRSLDTGLRDQMRLMGLSLPPDNALQNSFSVNSLGGYNNAYSRQSGGGFGGGLAPEGPAGRYQESMKKESDSSTTRKAQEAIPKRKFGTEPEGRGRASLQTGDNASNNLREINGLEQSSLDSAQVQELTKQNRFVSFRIPTDKPEPTVDVLKSLALQAGVPILIDPGVPTGKKFAIKGTISPRPLVDALNLLAPYARLEWKWVGDSIFISASPDFEVMFGEIGSGGNSYGPRKPLTDPKKTDSSPASKAKP